MKARVKATGLVSEVCPYSPIYLEGVDNCFYPDEVEIVDTISDSPDYWTRLEHQAAIAAMQGLCANYTEFTKDNDGTLSNTGMIVENSRLIAHALVEKMKEVRK